MRYTKFILATLLSLLNVWLCSRTIEYHFNPMIIPILTIASYCHHTPYFVYILTTLCFETAVTFAIFYGFFRNEIRNRKLYLYEIISCCTFAIIYQINLHGTCNLYDIYAEKIDLICRYYGLLNVFIPCMLIQLLHIAAISVVLFINKRGFLTK